MTSTNIATQTTAQVIKSFFTESPIGRHCILSNDYAGQRALTNYLKTMLPNGVEFASGDIFWVDYDNNWSNSTGYLDGATIADLTAFPNQGPSAIYVTLFVSVCPQGRLILLYKTAVGNIVLFQRYTGNRNVIVVNAPSVFNSLLNSNLSPQVINLITTGGMQSLVSNVIQEVELSVNEQYLQIEVEPTPEDEYDFDGDLPRSRKLCKALKAHANFKQFKS